MNSQKFIGLWTQGLAGETPELREKIELAFCKAAKDLDDWFYKIVIDGKDYFVHFSAIQSSGFKTLPEGVSVLFKPGKGQKGLQAEEVEVA